MVGAVVPSGCYEGLENEEIATFRASCPFNGEPLARAVFSEVSTDVVYDPTLHQYVLALINATPAGSRLRGSTYSFTDSAIASALNAAAARGVEIDLVFDDNDWSSSKIDALSSAIDATVCQGACIFDATAAGIQHTKLFTASRVCDGSSFVDDVSVVSSANWDGAMRSMHNNMIVIREDAGLYEGFSAHIDDMVDANAGGPYDANYYRTFAGSDDAYRGYSFPRAGGPDTIVETIDAVDCAGDGEIRVAMAYWTPARAAILHDALVPKAEQGCTVELVVGDDIKRNQEFLAEHLVPVGCVAHPGTSCAIDGVNYRLLADRELHHKYMIIHARHEGSASKRKLVLTGSHNYQSGALVRWDESLLLARSAALYDAYRDNFDALWDRGYAGVAGGGEYCGPSKPCPARVGDCDADDECMFKGDCRRDAADEFDASSPAWLDVCMAPGDWHFCREGERECSAGEGDCDTTADCKPGVTCHQFDGADICQDYQGTQACAHQRCGVGEGDCDHDGECDPGLKCVQYSTQTGYGWNADYCMAPGLSGYCSPLSPCGFGEGHCADSSECEPGLTCTEAGRVDICRAPAGEWCTPSAPCSLGEGDCDTHSDCAEGFCQQVGSAATPDTCFENGGGSFCTANDPCPIGTGDCDTHAHCGPGLYCVQFEADRVGFDTDYCLPVGHAEFCQVGSPCDKNQGDCDSNADCLPGLTCVESGIIDLCM
ncbi:MAG: phospholipase D-like domain-containing protein [Myxococcota bacterium]